MSLLNLTRGLSNISLLSGGATILLTGSYLIADKIISASYKTERKADDSSNQYINSAFKIGLVCIGIGLAFRIPSLFSRNPRNLFPASTTNLCLESAESFSASKANYSIPSDELLNGIAKLMGIVEPQKVTALSRSTGVKIYEVTTKSLFIPAKLTVAGEEIEMGLFIDHLGEPGVRSRLMFTNISEGNPQLLKNYFAIGDALRAHATSEKNRTFYRALLYSRGTTLDQILADNTDSFKLIRFFGSSNRSNIFGIFIKDNAPLDDETKAEFLSILRDHLQLRFAIT